MWFNQSRFYLILILACLNTSFLFSTMLFILFNPLCLSAGCCKQTRLNFLNRSQHFFRFSNRCIKLLFCCIECSSIRLANKNSYIYSIMLWSWNIYHLAIILNCFKSYFKIWLFHLTIYIQILIHNCVLVAISLQSSFQEASNHLELFDIKLCIGFLTYSNHSMKSFLWWFFCHRLQDNLKHQILNSFYQYSQLACFLDRIQIILVIHRFILLQQFVCMFISQNYQLNKDCSILRLLYSRMKSALRLDLYLIHLIIDIVWIALMLNTSFLILTKLFLFCCFLHNVFFCFFFSRFFN